MRKFFMYWFSISLMLSCVPAEKKRTWDQIPIPASEGSLYPNLYSDKEHLFLSWLEKRDTLDHLFYSRFDGKVWTEGKSIASGNNWFVNWADFPSLHRLPNDRLIAHYLAKNGASTYAYGVQIQSSDLDQVIWGAASPAHQDSSETEHGFATFFDISMNESAIVWLDGRAYAADKDGPMSLRMAHLSEEGKPHKETLLDARVCDCCQTDAISTPGGAMIVYRDRSETEIRDIYRILYRDGQWSEPMVVHPDQWKISGCPVNGPAIASQDKQVAVAWFSRAQEQAKVQLSFSNDEGETMQKPIRIDLGNPEGRVDIVMREDHAWITWMELEEASAKLYIRQVWTDGRMSEPESISTMNQSRASGFPILTDWHDALWVSWTEIDETKGSQVVLMRKEI